MVAHLSYVAQRYASIIPMAIAAMNVYAGSAIDRNAYDTMLAKTKTYANLDQ